jgi:hypothetical protein
MVRIARMIPRHPVICLIRDSDEGVSCPLPGFGRRKIYAKKEFDPDFLKVGDHPE